MARLAWVDSARGIAITLVVLLHTSGWLTEAGLGIPFWETFNAAFSTLRMPLFFMLAGLFAAKWVAHSWVNLWTEKLSLLYWIFLIWSGLGAVFAVLSLGINGGQFEVVKTLGALGLSLIRPRFEVWFIWALALFFITAKLSKRATFLPQALVAGALSIAISSGYTTSNIGWNGATQYYIFFLAGLHLRGQIIEFANRLTPVNCLALVLAWSPGALWLATGSPAGAIPGVLFLGTVFGMIAGLSFSKLLIPVTPLLQLGTKTLPVYVLHTPIAILASLAFAQGFMEWAPLWLRAVMPIAVAAAAIFCSLGIYSLGAKSVLFRAPRWFVIQGTRLFSRAD
ncbi:putative membrane protein YcfT [Pseudarthrobacter siccitolerans]|uniref:Membrane protein YcfT n=1 Tax=Pseudarthrobacter siccitolerans TaxID=861266 RepID=A0ABU0PJ72_9MICC|nr:acyltransferase family protein [Pseudarthrobacter siccitolerans]MDQ0674000.1 putative membrane protein YcfT [Pseudarthrobacter siccitolerans]